MRNPTPLRLLALGAGLAAALVLTAPAGAGVSLSVGLQVGTPPPPPVFVFEDEPEVVLIPQTRVYYVPGPAFDLFRYGRYWYINNGGWWYRAHHYRGPFENVAFENVPSTILRVPAKYHRHPLGGPPGQTGLQPGRGNAYGLDRSMNLDKRKWEGSRPPAKAEGRPQTRPSEKPQAKPEKKEWKRDK